MGSGSGISDEKILALEHFQESPLFDDLEKTVLEYADRITLTDQDVSDELFSRLEDYFDSDQIIELTAIVAWENFSSKFNRALRVESQGLWKQTDV